MVTIRNECIQILKFLTTENECVYILNLLTTKKKWVCSHFKISNNGKWVCLHFKLTSNQKWVSFSHFKFLTTENECVYILNLLTTKNEWGSSGFKLLSQVPNRHNHYWVTSIEVNFFEIKFEINLVFFSRSPLFIFLMLKHIRDKAFQDTRIWGCKLLSKYRCRKWRVNAAFLNPPS